jgi:hypothetical protein
MVFLFQLIFKQYFFSLKTWLWIPVPARNLWK